MSEKPEARAEAATENVIEERQQTLAEMLIFGASRREVTQFAEAQWGLSRRTAQEYLKRVRERLARDEAAQDRLFYLKLSQLQRDKLVGLALRYAHENRERLDPKVLQSLAAITTAVRGLLDSRDRAAGEIHQLVVEQLREANALVAAEPPGTGDGTLPTCDLRGTLETDGQTDAGPTPPPAGVRDRIDGAHAPWPKPNGSKEMSRIQDNTEIQNPACAGCADDRAPDRALAATG
jgi:hypothetical protein